MLPELATLFEKLQLERIAIRTLVDEAPDGALDRPGQGVDGGASWSAREMLAHVVSSEHGLLALARAIVSGNGHVLPAGYDLRAENAKAVAKRRGLSSVDLLLEWERGQAAWQAFLEAVTSAQMELSGTHPASTQPMTLRTLIIVMLRHERGHRVEMAGLLKGG